MQVPVNRRKFYAPSLPAFHQSRPGLQERLAAGRGPQTRLTLLTAGPGWGKSLLAAELVRAFEGPTLWYGLGEGDRDLAVFLAHLNAGLARSVPGFQGAPAEVLADPQGGAEAVLGAIAEDLDQLAPEGCLLVLDDLHLVVDSPAVASALETLVQYFPEQGQLVFLSRTRPPLRLAPYAVRGQLLELGPTDLALDGEAIAGVLGGLGADPARAPEVLRQTEGWPVAVVCAAQAAGAGAAPGASLSAYLAQEVEAGLEALSPDLQEFLLTCAFFPRLEPGLYRAVTGRDDFDRRLSEAEAQGLFLIKRAGLQGGHAPDAYHQFAPLFREFLRERATARWSAERVGEIARQLAYALSAEQPEQAVAYSLAAGDVKRAERLVVQLADELLGNHRPEALKRLLASFTPEQLNASPWLQLNDGELARYQKEFDRALCCYRRAEDLADQAGDPAAKGRALAYRAAVHAARGDGEVYGLVQRAKDLIPPEDGAGRAFAYNTLGVYHLAHNEVAPAQTYLREARALYRQLGDQAGEARASHNLGLAATKEGRFQEALEAYREAVAHSQAAGRYAMPVTHHNLAVVHLYAGDLDAAEGAAQTALDVARQLRSRWDQGHALLTLGRIACARDDFRRAAARLEDARSLAVEAGDRLFEANALLGLAELSRRQGQPGKARQLVEEAIALRGLPLEDPAMLEVAIELAKVRLDAGEPASARTLLASCEGYLARHQHLYRLAEVHLLLARATGAVGDAEAADAARAKAGAIAREHGFAALLAAAEEPGGGRSGPTAGAPGDAELRIRCFGRFAVEVEGAPIDQKRWSGHKAKLLLAYLLHHRRGATRQELLDLFYSDSDPSTGALNVLVTRLRQALEPRLTQNRSSRYVRFEDGRYRFDFAVRYAADVEEFTYLTDRAQDPGLDPEARYALLAQAVALYDGPFLAEFDEAWCQLEREGYRRKLAAAYEKLYAHGLQRGEHAQVAALAERHLKVDRLAEGAHQARIRVLAHQGRREDALRHFKLMDQLFVREFGTGPSEETLKLVRRIQRGQPLDGAPDEQATGTGPGLPGA